MVRISLTYLDKHCAALTVLVHARLTAVVCGHTKGGLVDGWTGLALQTGVRPLLLLRPGPSVLQPAADLERGVLVLGMDGVAGAELVRLVLSPAEGEDHAASEEGDTHTAE